MSAKKFKTYLQNQDPECLIDELLTRDIDERFYQLRRKTRSFMAEMKGAKAVKFCGA